jgi:hypothetical protein
MNYLRDWAGIISVVLLFAGLLGDVSQSSPRTIALLGFAVLAYSLNWYNFALVADKFGGLSIRRGLTVSVIGVVGTLSGVANVGLSVPIGWVLLGLAMLGVAWGILKALLLPDGFAWLSGIAGLATILVGITGDTSNVGTGAIYILLFWTISMSILFIGWGHLNIDPKDEGTEVHN